MREMAAVLACGPQAVISHRSAAVLRQLVIPARASLPIDVTVRARDRRRRPGVRLHRSQDLDPDEITLVDGIPVTSSARTLLDLATVAGARAGAVGCASG
jgi:hypothetical protein